MKQMTFILCVVLFVGCSSATPPKTMTTTELKYKRVLFLPIVDGPQELQQKAFNGFYTNLKTADDILFVPQEEINQQYLNNIGLENTPKYSVIDFSVNEKGLDRRRRIRETSSSDAIILASMTHEKNVLAMYVQMIDVEDGELTLSFSKVLDIPVNVDSTLNALTKICAEKVITHIRDNVVITTIHKY